jgi:hypothetical protein
MSNSFPPVIDEFYLGGVTEGSGRACSNGGLWLMRNSHRPGACAHNAGHLGVVNEFLTNVFVSSSLLSEHSTYVDKWLVTMICDVTRALASKS